MLEQFLANQRGMRSTQISVIDDVYKFDRFMFKQMEGVTVYMVHDFNMDSISDILCSFDRASPYNHCK
jgi:hypothetical protein